jgi:hypothetical protein
VHLFYGGRVIRVNCAGWAYIYQSNMNALNNCNNIVDNYRINLETTFRLLDDNAHPQRASDGMKRLLDLNLIEHT